MSEHIRLIGLQILIWATYLFSPLYFFARGEAIVADRRLLILYLFVGLVSILGYYLNIKFLLPKFYVRGKYVLFTLLSVSFFTLLFFGSSKLLSQFEDLSIKEARVHSYRVRIMLLWIVSIGVFSARRYKQLELEKMKVELSALKAQINPHFLFNVLNDIYALALKKSDLTPKSILKLSSIMRYVTIESDTELVELEKEVQYVNNYVELQRLRLTEKTLIKIDIKGNVQSKRIPPLLLISFIENAFKYGVSNEHETIIAIQLFIDNDHLRLIVQNNKPKRTDELNESDHVGMKNTIKRLDLLYDNKYSLEVLNEENKFKIELQIPLNQ